MKNIFFRTTSLWASVLYMALGLVLTFWPGMSGTVFCWGIAAALILYAAHSFWYFKKPETSASLQAARSSSAFSALRSVFSAFPARTSSSLSCPSRSASCCL